MSACCFVHGRAAVLVSNSITRLSRLQHMGGSRQLVGRLPLETTQRGWIKSHFCFKGSVMQRRSFTKMLALGAGTYPFMPVDAEETREPSAAQNSVVPQPDESKPRATRADTHVGDDPVNIAEFVPLAKSKLPKATFEYISTGSGEEVTLRENVAAYRRIRVVPPLLHGVAAADLSVNVMKQRVALPILLAPVAALRMYHPHGALAAARAAAACGTICVVSSSAGSSVEEIAAVSAGPKWFQLYVPKDRVVARRLVERVDRAGFQAIVVTVDLGESKDADRRNRFSLPKEMLLKHLRDIGHEQLSDQISYEDLLAFNDQAWDLSLSWDFFDWLRSITKLPLLVKGVLRKEDALRAVSIGLDGIIVSNHGGRRLDGMPASIDVLAEIAQAVDSRAEVLLDGGIRRGTDVLKALALGAKAVLIGRAQAWALAANGEAGVKHALELLEEELLNAMVTTGCAAVSQVNSSLLQM